MCKPKKKFLLFGPSGIGKSTITTNLGGFDLESLPESDRLAYLLNSQHSIYGAADVNPTSLSSVTSNLDDFHFIVLNMPYAKYIYRRLSRDLICDQQRDYTSDMSPDHFIDLVKKSSFPFSIVSVDNKISDTASIILDLIKSQTNSEVLTMETGHTTVETLLQSEAIETVLEQPTPSQHNCESGSASSVVMTQPLNQKSNFAFSEIKDIITGYLQGHYNKSKGSINCPVTDYTKLPSFQKVLASFSNWPFTPKASQFILAEASKIALRSEASLPIMIASAYLIIRSYSLYVPLKSIKFINADEVPSKIIGNILRSRSYKSLVNKSTPAELIFLQTKLAVHNSKTFFEYKKIMMPGAPSLQLSNLQLAAMTFVSAMTKFKKWLDFVAKLESLL